MSTAPHAYGDQDSDARIEEIRNNYRAFAQESVLRVDGKSRLYF